MLDKPEEGMGETKAQDKVKTSIFISMKSTLMNINENN